MSFINNAVAKLNLFLNQKKDILIDAAQVKGIMNIQFNPGQTAKRVETSN